MPWFLYILRCGDGTLYTGVTSDVRRRLREHRAGIGARYTRGRGPLRLVHRERFKTRSAAQKREAAIKSSSRIRKLQLIKGA
ncbi:MAG TPA: GIY-YIG nuclease family protein [Candidatus Paceibacterota bacterium]|nr:GIY-YIG nuclease family protein [Candidatus Paceibacterota bacterium]